MREISTQFDERRNVCWRSIQNGIFTSWAWQMTHSSLSSATLKQIWIMQSLRLPRLLISRLFVYLFVCLFDCLLVCLFVSFFLCMFLFVFLSPQLLLWRLSHLPLLLKSDLRVCPHCDSHHLKKEFTVGILFIPITLNKRVYSWHPFNQHPLFRTAFKNVWAKRPFGK